MDTGQSFVPWTCFFLIQQDEETFVKAHRYGVVPTLSVLRSLNYPQLPQQDIKR